MGIRCLLVEEGLVSWICEEDHDVDIADMRRITNPFSVSQWFLI